MADLKKDIESMLKAVVDAQLSSDGLTATVVKGHTTADKIDLPYLVVSCQNTPRDPTMPAETYAYRPAVQILAVWDIDETATTSEAVIDSWLNSALCAYWDISAIKTECQSNYPTIHVHDMQYSDSITDNDGEVIRYDGWLFEMVMEEIDDPA